MDGTDLRKLTRGGLLDAFDYLDSGTYQDPWTNVSRDGQLYTVADSPGSNTGLSYGLVNDNQSPLTPVPLPAGQNAVIGWTTL